MTAPDALSVPLRCWLRGDTVILEEGGIIEWPDRSGNGRGQIPTAGSGPLWVAADPDYNNQPLAQFDGSQVMQAINTGGIANPWTLLVIGQAERGTALIGSPASQAPPEDYMLFVNPEGPPFTVPFQWYSASPLGPSFSAPTPPISVMLEGDATISGTNMYIQDLETPQLSTLGPIFDIWPLGLACNEAVPAFAEPLNGKIAEVCMWEGALLSPEDRVGLMAYIQERYYAAPPGQQSGRGQSEIWRRLRCYG